MFTKIKGFIYLPIAAGMIALMGCAAAPTYSQQPAIQSPGQTPTRQSVQQPAQPVAQIPAQTSAQQNSGQPTTSSINPSTAPPVLSNRVDVVYFHANLRCVTCLCFEKEVTNVIKTYFQDAINNGKLTYRVLNIQEPQNAAIAKKYGALGSQLFINNVMNDFDNIEDIQDIWSWNCVDNPAGFDTKVKNLIELRLNGQR